MTTYSITDLFTASTRDEIMGEILTIASDVGLAITAWQSGQPSRTIFAILSQKIADTTLANAEVIKGGYLDSATGAWLTLLAQCLYKVTRLPAQYATGNSLEITNSSTANVEYLAGEMIVAHEITGATYRNTADLVLAPGVTSSIVILADVAGVASNAAAGKVTVIANPDLAVTNLEAILGSDAETDDELRERCRNKLDALSPNGPRDVYSFIAKTPEYSATSVPITRVSPVTDPTTGVITVYLATAAGAPSGGDVAIVDTAFDLWATPLCTTAVAAAASALSVPVTYQVWIKGTVLTSSQIEDAIADALDVYFKTIPIGGDIVDPDVTGYVRTGLLELVIGKAVAGIVKVAIAAPTGDVTLTAGQVPTLGTVTPTVTVIP